MKRDKKKINKGYIWLVIALVCVAVLTTAIVVFLSARDSSGETEDSGTESIGANESAEEITEESSYGIAYESIDTGSRESTQNDVHEDTEDTYVTVHENVQDSTHESANEDPQESTQERVSESESTKDSVVTEAVNDDSTNGLVIYSTEEKGDVIYVSTSYVDFEYPYAFADIIRVEPASSEQGDALEFKALLDGESYDLYTIHFGRKKGHAVGTVRLGEDKQEHSIYVEFFDIDDDLDEDYSRAFYAAQETFNDVVVSLEKNDNYTSSYAE